MKKIYSFLLLIVCQILVFNSLAQKSLRLERNEGQWDSEILYKAERKEGKVFIRQDRVTFLVFDSTNFSFHPHTIEHKDGRERYSVFSLRPLNTKEAKIEEMEMCEGYTNYFKGNDKTKWKTNVRSVKGLVFKEIYDKIDWQIETSFADIKHTFVVYPSGNVEDIKVEYNGADLYEKDGQLHIVSKYGEIIEDKPYIYQKIGDKEVEIQGQYIVQGNVVSYKIENYDRKEKLYIDPGLVFSTYVGSHSDSWGMTSCYDAKRMMISGGIVHGASYPYTEGAYDVSYSGDWDCVITKYDSLGENLIFSTFLGGSQGEMPHSMIVNKNNEIVLYGTTGSFNFPTTSSAYQRVMHQGDSLLYDHSVNYPYGSDIFVACLAPMGDELIASTFIGGSGNDGLNFKPYYDPNTRVLYGGNDSLYYNYGDCARGELITDSVNNVYVGSCTFSTDFPTTANAFQTTNHGGQEAVVFKFDHSLSSLIFSTYLGGVKDDAAYSIDIDNLGRIYVAGGCVSSDFPSTSSAYNSTHNGGTTDAFLSLLSSDGETLISSTFFGSSEYDQAYFVRLDKNYYPYIYGQTKATGYTLIHNVNYSIPNSGQFIAKFSPLLDTLIWSTTFGSGLGIVNISPSGFAVDICDRIYCAGWGRVFKSMQAYLGYNFLGTTNMQTTSNAYMTNTDGQDFYIISLNKDAESLDYASFFGEVSTSSAIGTDHVDGGTSRFDRYGNLYQTICASCGASQGLPTTINAWSNENASSNCNMASVKFNINDDFAVADFETPTVSCKETEVAFQNTSRGDLFYWSFGDGETSTLENPTHIYHTNGLFEVTLVTKLNAACREYDTIRKNVLILADSSYYIDTVRACYGMPVQIGLNYFSIVQDENLTFRWQPAELLSDTTICNPYVTITAPTLLTLVIDNTVCKDTVYQFVDLITIENDLPDTLRYCTLPHTYNIPTNDGITVRASYQRDFMPMLPLSTQNHTLTIKDTNRYLYVMYQQGSCRSIDSVWLEFEGYDFTLQTHDETCSGYNDGKAEVTSNTFPGNVTYTWSNQNSTTSLLENIPSGNYYVTLSSENGCSTTKEFSINPSIIINIAVEKTDNSCHGVNNGEISLIVSGGDYPYTYLWSNNSSDSTISNLSEGNYTYNVTDSKGCIMTGDVEIQPLDSVSLTLYATNNNCETGCSASAYAKVTGGTLPYRYYWSTGETIKDIINLCNGDYTLEVKDRNGCENTASVHVTNIDIFQDFEVTASKTQVYDGNRVTLDATYIEGFEYSWFPSTHLSNPYNHTTTAIVYETTTYTVYATDNKGCSEEDTITIFAEYVECSEPNIYIPNVFTPNNDGKNDRIGVSGDFIDNIDFAIYDRWGEKVFHTTDITEQWDGTFRNSPCQAGVYYYRLEVKCTGGKTFLKGGDITLIR